MSAQDRFEDCTREAGSNKDRKNGKGLSHRVDTAAHTSEKDAFESSLAVR